MGSGGDVPAPLRGLVDDAMARWQSGPRPADDEAAGILAEAIAAREVAPVYQPIVALPGGEAVAVEALVRIPTCDDARLATAIDIISVAERSGLIVPLGLDVLGRACVEARRWRQRSGTADLQIHVNVSPLQLRDDRFVDAVDRTLTLASLPAQALVLEITETAAFENDGLAEAVLQTLAGVGVELAVDDFGTGFASLEVLAATSARSIKLDRSFVASVGDLGEPPRGRAAVVRAAIGLGRSLGLRIVAEGIERPSQARTLTAWGCEFGQGYLYGRPSAADEVAFAPVLVLEDGATLGAGRVHLTPGAIDLATSAAIVLATGDPEPGTRRADALVLAIALAERAGLDRRGADVAALLASIGDAAEHLPGVVGTTSALPAPLELATALAATPRLGEQDGAVGAAAAAWYLAGARRAGAELDTCLRELGADPTGPTARPVVDWWNSGTIGPAPLAELNAIERRLRSRGDSGRRLRSLTALTRAIGTPGSLLDVLEVTAEEARSAIGASSLSISQFEPEHGRLRTLINVGDLAAWEERRPTDETYLLDEYPQGASRLLDGVVHWLAAAEGGGDAAETELLRRLGKGSSVAVPIVVDGASWGEAYATTEIGAPPFSSADVPFLSAVAGVISLAVSRTQHVERLTRFADEDPLTRIPNRRVLERRLHELLEQGEAGDIEVGLLMLDVDGLKDVNDEWGHPEGDALLVRVADVLSRVAMTRSGAWPARLGGDEFCIAMLGTHGVEELLNRIRVRLADGPPPQPRLSAGFAAIRAGEAPVSELLRRADAAQYLAKRTGAPLVAVGPDSDIPDPESVTPSPSRRSRRGRSRSSGTAATPSLQRWRASCEGGTPVERLEALGDVTVGLLDLNRWTLSELDPDGRTLRVRSLHLRRRRPNPQLFSLLADETYDITQFPATAAALEAGTGFSVHVDDAAADRQERSVLTDYGVKYVVAIPSRDVDGTALLLELYGDAESATFAEARALAEAMGSRTLGRDLRCGPTHESS